MNLSHGLMCVLAHPDDETMALGGTLAMYAFKGIATSLVMATRGERGWHGEPAAYPGPLALGQMREAELRSAAGELGVRNLVFLDEVDGELDQADVNAIVKQIVAEIRRVRPAVVVTFGPDGAYGHPDHIAISQLTTTAVICAAYPEFEDPSGAPAHRVSKLYYRIWTADESAVFRSVFENVGIDVAGVRRELVSWPDWAVTTQIDTGDYWPEVRDAVACHRSQIESVSALAQLDARGHRRLWGTQQFFRAMSVVPVDPGLESDLFAGLPRRPNLALVNRLTPPEAINQRRQVELVTPA